MDGLAGVRAWAALSCRLLKNARGRGVAGTQSPVGLGDAFAARASCACLRPLEVHIPWVARQSSRREGRPDGSREYQMVERPERGFPDARPESECSENEASSLPSVHFQLQMEFKWNKAAGPLRFTAAWLAAGPT